jgi:hypothetical protein
MMPLLSLLLACDIPPNHVETADIDNALARKHYKTMCVGLKMSDEQLRTHTTERLRTIIEDDGIAIAEACVCENIQHEHHGWDRAIAAGLSGKKGDGMVDCFAALVQDQGLPDRLEAINALAQIPAPVARQTLIDIASSSSPSEQRARAIMAIGANPDHRETMLTLLKDSDPDVRAAAARALGDGAKDGAVKEALRVAITDAEATVRAAALQAIKKLAGAGADEAICGAMMNDPDPVVREAAVLSFKGTRRGSAITCIRDRAFAAEESPAVREAVLTVLKSSPRDEAADVLCEAIPFWVKTYLKEDLPDRIPGTDIITAQNDRDWERSYECVTRAARAGGVSCYGRMYVGYWVNRLGGTARIPACPKYQNP